MAEFKQRFVDAAPNADRRGEIFTAFEVYFAEIQSLFANGELWLNGGFVTHKTQAPKDIDVAVVVDGVALTSGFGPKEWQRVWQVMTLQGVTAAKPPVRVGRLQPIAGLVDSFILDVSDVAAKKLWDTTWSRVTDGTGKVIPGKIKGYAEVTW